MLVVVTKAMKALIGCHDTVLGTHTLPSRASVAHQRQFGSNVQFAWQIMATPEIGEPAAGHRYLGKR